MKLLIADDDHIMREVLDKLLKKHGHQALFADNGLDALKALKADKFDVLLLDIKLPMVHGTEILEEINNGNTLDNDIPIIVISAHAFDSEIEWISSYGISRYLVKPIDLDELVNTIHLVVKNKEGPEH